MQARPDGSIRDYGRQGSGALAPARAHIEPEASIDLKGSIMKRIGILLSAVTVAVASASAFADPSSADETSSFASSFPQITTHADLHRNDLVTQASTPFPSSA